MNTTEQVKFNHLHIDCIVRDKRFRRWENLTHEERIAVTKEAEELAKAEFDK